MAHHLCIYCNKENPEAEVDGEWFHIDCYQENSPMAHDVPKFRENIKSIKRVNSSDREDWLKIYCSVIEARGDRPQGITNTVTKNYVQYANELHQAFKERWAEE
jgi:hypothetical protein